MSMTSETSMAASCPVSALRGKKDGKRGALRVLLVGAQEHLAELRASLRDLREPALELVETPAEPKPNDDRAAPAADVAMVVLNGNQEESLNCLARAASQSPRPALFALLQERSPALMKRALRAGADELLFLPLDSGEATRALLKLSESRRREDGGLGGTICSMMSLVGGAGVTSLSANLALALRYALDKRVVLVDLDLQTGALGNFLNLEPERTLMALVEGGRKLDSLQLETALSKHDSGLYLLAAPKRIEDSELVSEAAVGAALELMRQLFDYVIVDCGTHVDAAKVAAWERSQRLFYLLDQSIGAARCAWRFLDLLGRLGLADAEPSFILSRFVPNHQIGEEQLSQTLGQPIFARIPRDEKALERATLSGRNLWQAAPNSPLTKSVERLARRLDGADDSQCERERWNVSRLFGAFAARG